MTVDDPWSTGAPWAGPVATGQQERCPQSAFALALMIQDDPSRNAGRSFRLPKRPSVAGVRFAGLLLVAGTLGAPPAAAQYHPSVYLECPCSVKSDGTTLTATFGPATSWTEKAVASSSPWRDRTRI